MIFFNYFASPTSMHETNIFHERILMHKHGSTYEKYQNMVIYGLKFAQSLDSIRLPLNQLLTR